MPGYLVSKLHIYTFFTKYKLMNHSLLYNILIALP